MSATEHRFLLLTAGAPDATWIEETLRPGVEGFSLHRAGSTAELAHEILRLTPDLLLADSAATGPDVSPLLAEFKTLAPHLPVILLGRQLGEDRAVAGLLAGAADCVPWEQIPARLPASITRVLQQAAEQNTRRETEAALRISESRLRSLFQNAYDIILIMDMDANVLDINRRGEELTGFPRDHLLKCNLLKDLVVPEDRGLLIDLLRRTGTGERLMVEIRWHTRLGQVRTLEAGAFSDITGRDKAGSCRCILRDITDHKKAETALKQSEERYALAMLGVQDGLWDWDLVTNRMFFSRRWKEMLGIEDQEVEDTYEEWARRVHPDDYPRVTELLAAHLTGRTDFYEAQYRLVHKDGGYRWILSRGVCLRDVTGKPTRMTGSHSDITERKNAEEALLTREAYLRAMLDNFPYMAWLKDVNSRFLAVNGAFARACGVEDPQSITGKTDLDIWPRELALKYRADDRNVITTRTRSLAEEPIADRGKVKWFETFKAPVCDPSGNVLGTTGFSHDVSQRKEAEEALRRRDQILRAVADAALVLLRAGGLRESFAQVFEIIGEATDMDRIGLFVSAPDPETGLPALVHRQGWVTPRRKLPTAAWPPFPQASWPRWWELLGQGQSAGGPVGGLPEDERAALAARGLHTVLTIPIRIKDQLWGCIGFEDFQKERDWPAPDEGLLRLLSGSIGEAVERKNAEEALAAAEEKYRGIVENAPMGIFQSSPDGQFHHINPALAQSFGVGSPEELVTLIRTANFPLAVSQEQREQMLREIHEAGDEILKYELQYTPPDSPPLTMHLSLRVVRKTPKGEIAYIEGFVEDITERKQAEAKIRTALQEKEVLLKEIHHRVKNNLQFVSSLLKLQSRYLKDAKARALFQESLSRLQTISLIHETFYRRGNLSQIDFGPYLDELLTHCARVYGGSARRPVIRASVQDVVLDLNTAIPCGLIIHELIANSFKHAFARRRNRCIEIDFRLDPGSGLYMLAVRDNGRGLPASLDIRNAKSLGLQLVNKLVEQLDGALQCKTGAGTSITITFKPHREETR